MPKYSSKTQSKNGGRRRKQTKRKLRRARKSRKVMRGGANKKITGKTLSDKLNEKSLMTFFLERYFTVQEESMNMPGFDDFADHYNTRFNSGKPETLGIFETQQLMFALALRKEQKDYNQDKGKIKQLGDEILYLEF